MSEVLRNLYLVVAQECNLACTYCYAAGGGFGQPERHMPEAIMRRGLARLLPLAGERLTLSFFGGEPLLNFTLLQETVRYASCLAAESGRGLSFALTTNGTLLDEAMLDFIERHIAYLAISLDGDAVANSGRVFRDGRPAFPVILDNLERLRQRRIPFALRATVTPANVGQVAETVAFLSALGAQSVRVLPAQGVIWSATEHQQLRHAMADLNRRGLQALLAGETPTACEHALRLAVHTVASEDAERPCLAGGGILALAADGMLYPCEHFVGVDELAMGHVDDYPDTHARHIAARFAAATTAGRPRCQACAVRGACGGQCYAEAYLANGNIELPAADYCGRIHATFRALAPDLAQSMADVEQAGRLRRAIGVE